MLEMIVEGEEVQKTMEDNVETDTGAVRDSASGDEFMDSVPSNNLNETLTEDNAEDLSKKYLEFEAPSLSPGAVVLHEQLKDAADDDSDDSDNVFPTISKKKVKGKKNLIDSDDDSDFGSRSRSSFARHDADDDIMATAGVGSHSNQISQKSSDNEKQTGENLTKTGRKIRSTWSDSDDEEEEGSNAKPSRLLSRSPSPDPVADDPKPWKDLVDSDEESDIVPTSNTTRGPTVTAAADSDAEDCLPSIPDYDPEYQRNSILTKKKTDEKPKKLTSKQREEMMKETLSRTQKLLREKPVSLPYEKPKALSLSEFLAKRAQAKAEFFNPELKKLRPPTPPPAPKESEVTYLDLSELEQPEPSEKVEGWFSSLNKEAEEKAADQKDQTVDDAFEKLDDLLLDDLNLNEINSDPEENNKIPMEEDQTNSEVPGDNPTNEVDQVSPLPSAAVSKVDDNTVDAIGEVHAEDCAIPAAEIQVAAAEPDASDPGETANGCAVEVEVKENELERDFRAKEAALEQYLESIKPKPQRKSLLEFLKMDPAYADVINIKPKFEGSGTIDLSGSKRSSKISSKMKGIETLKNRFRKHTAPIKKPKEQLHVVTVTSKEEDSQGNLNSTVNKVNYVQHLSDDEDSNLKNGTNISPARQTPPGLKFSQLRDRLQAKIRANKVKEYEEKLKNYSIYENEKTLEEKGPLDEADDILDDDDFSTESEPEETDEEAEALKEALRRKKKKKTKSAFVDEEAEVSESEANDGDEEDDEESDVDGENDDCENGEGENMEEGEDAELAQKKSKRFRRVIAAVDSSDDEDVEIITLDDEPYPLTKETKESNNDLVIPKEEPIMTEGFASQAFTSEVDFLALETDSPHITPAQRGFAKLIDGPILPSPVREPLPPSISQLEGFPSSGWNFEQRKKSTFFSSTPLERFDSQAALDCFEKDHMQGTPPIKPLPTEIAKLVGNSGTELPSPDVDTESICSGKFPSQQPQTPAESQCLGFGSPTPSKSAIINPVVFTSGNDPSTPKVEIEREKVKKTRLLFTELDKTDPNSGDDDNDVIGRVVKKRNRRLHFSDDEEDTEIEEKDKEEEEEDPDVERGYDSEENEIVLPKTKPIPIPKGLVSKAGKIRREFVENEAELSGSEEGSGDEDERGLDQMDDEDGDLEDIDEEDLRDQIGKQHIRNLIDDDDRQVRFLQNVLLEDGDLHGDGELREKQFKWKHIDKLDFDMGLGEEGAEGAPVEDEAERLWQEQKADKARWLKENSQSLTQEFDTHPEDEDSQKIFLENSKHFKLGKSTLRKIQSSCSFVEMSSSSCSESMTTFDLTTDGIPSRRSSLNAQTQALFASPDDPIRKLKRGSFLARGTAGLTKIAEMTKGTESTNSIKINSRNFVFSVITPPEPDPETKNRKRKSYARHPATRQEMQARKMPRVDRSFDSLDAATKATSIFSQF